MPNLSLEQEVQRFMEMGPLYHDPPGSRAWARRQAEDQLYEAEQVIDSITDQPLPTEHWKKTTTESGKEMIVKQNSRHFSFNFTDPRSRVELYKNLYGVVEKFMNKLPVSARWLVQYKFGERWFSVPITKDTLPEMLDQIDAEILDFNVDGTCRKGIAESSMELDLQPHNYRRRADASYGPIHEPSDGVFVCHMQQISEIHFIDTTAYAEIAIGRVKNAPKKKAAKTKPKKAAEDDGLEGLSKAELIALLRQSRQGNKTREGAFFKYICTLPIDLKKFQIFHKIDAEACKSIDENNCVVWALKQTSLNPDIVERIKSLIGTRHFPKSKFQPIADDTGVAFTVKYYRPNSERTDVERYVPKEQEPVATISLILFDEHYMLDDTVPISIFAIKHLEEIQAHPKCSKWTWEQILTTTRYIKSKDRYEKTPNVKTPIMQLIRVLFEQGHFSEIHYGDFAPYATVLYKEKVAPLEKLDYNPKWCTRKKEQRIKKSESKKAKLFQLKKVVYADFECSTDGIHQPYNLCAMTADGVQFRSWGESCAEDFLRWKELIDGTQIYFHNLSYDINFLINKLDEIVGTPIIKSGRTLQLDGRYRGKYFRFKDSLAIISNKLEMFPEMFGLEGIQKEVFPYNYYNSKVLADGNKIGDVEEACKVLRTDSDRALFKENLAKLLCYADEEQKTFDMEGYSNFYCMQDVKILHDGFERFRNDLLHEFDIDAYYFVSISSIANRLFEKEVYWKNGNLYDLAGTPREFISRAVLGGRVMMAENKKQRHDDETNPICDFDAVSLYPSAISRLYTVEGIPHVIPGNNIYWLLDHLMDDEQAEPDMIHFISAFVIEIEITKVKKPRQFPLIVRNPDFQTSDEETERSVNAPCRMYVDHITLCDLIKYQEIEFRFIRGYYWDGKRDFSIRDCIKNLFELRLKYKAQDNPLQQIIKLIMNSVYGKTILKPIEHKIVFKSLEDSEKYIKKNYNTIESMEHIYGSNLVKFKKLKPINDHYNFCLFGVNILSMSKRIMNEVMCLAEDKNIRIFYQDTDSMHLYQKDVQTLADSFKESYDRDLVGKRLGQFHSDFGVIEKEMPVAIRSLFCGKKSYIDMLRDSEGNLAFHARMKGVPMESIAAKANEMFPESNLVKYDSKKVLFIPLSRDEDKDYSIMLLYQTLYDGTPVEFDLCADGRPCFDMKNDFSIETKIEFKRKLKF